MMMNKNTSRRMGRFSAHAVTPNPRVTKKMCFNVGWAGFLPMRLMGGTTGWQPFPKERDGRSIGWHGQALLGRGVT